MPRGAASPAIWRKQRRVILDDFLGEESGGAEAVVGERGNGGGSFKVSGMSGEITLRC
jgi:hypothetical protein